jgi:hypothetical protein
VNVPRPLRPLVRTRTRLTCTVGLLSAVLVAALLPLVLWSASTSDRPGDRHGITRAAPAFLGPHDETTARVEARRTGKDVLVDTATTGTTLTWARPNGQLKAQIHAVPQRAKNADGQWTPVDAKLSKTKGELGVRPGNVTVPVRFAAGGTRTAESVLAETDLAGHTITYTWPGPLPEPVLDGSRALYPEVLPGVDLLLVARDEGGFGQLLIVKTAAAATSNALASLNYGLRAPKAVFRRDATTGGVRILDPVSAKEIGSIPTPLAWDSSGKDPDAPGAARTATTTSAEVLQLSGLNGIEPGTRQAPMATRLDGDRTGTARLHLDVAAGGLLAEKNVRFPIFLDPTINSGELQWTFGWKQSPNSNFNNGHGFNGTTTEARVGHEDDTGGTARSFWKMGYRNIKNATISKAVFKVNNTHSWSCSAREFQLWSTEAISSGTTWNKQPTWVKLQQKKSFALGYNSSCGGDYVSFNVEDAAKVGAGKGATSLTFGLRATSETDTFTWRKFDARSAALEVDYNTAPNKPTGVTSNPGGSCLAGAGRTVAKTNLVLTAVGSDPDDDLRYVRFRFWKTGTTAPAGTVVTPDNKGKATLTIPTTSLVDKTTYSWQAQSEDTTGADSDWVSSPTACQITIDASAPPAPDVESEVFQEATPDGDTWSTVTFGGTGKVTFTSSGAASFTYALDGVEWSKPQPATTGCTQNPDNTPSTVECFTVDQLKPRHAGPTVLHVVAHDLVGNPSQTTKYAFYVPPADTADGPGDTSGDGIADLVTVDASGNLRTFPGDTTGELNSSLAASYSTGNVLNPAGHWFNPATGKAALIAKYSDVYPGDGRTDLFARTPDGGFWLYPGDGYGSFNVDKRLRVILPPNVPAPSTWTQVKAVGDLTGDKLPDLAILAGAAFWVLNGYTGASFQQATLMEGTAWANREVVHVADVDLDNTPDLQWRNLDTGIMYLRHGKPGTVAGSVNLDSLKSAAASRQGDVQFGTSWTKSFTTAVVGIPDVNGDKIPDLWVRFGSDGQIRVYHQTKTSTGAAVKIVQTDNWATVKAFG